MLPNDRAQPAAPDKPSWGARLLHTYRQYPLWVKVVIAIAAIRVSRQELTGAMPAPNEAAPHPATVQEQEDRAALAAAVRPCRFC